MPKIVCLPTGLKLCLLSLLFSSFSSNAASLPRPSKPDSKRSLIGPFPKTVVYDAIDVGQVNLPPVKIVFTLPTDGRNVGPGHPRYLRNRAEAQAYFAAKKTQVRADALTVSPNVIVRGLSPVSPVNQPYNLASPGPPIAMFGINFFPRAPEQPRVRISYDMLTQILEWAIIVVTTSETDGQLDISGWAMGHSQEEIEGKADFSISFFLFWTDDNEDLTQEGVNKKIKIKEPEPSLGGLISFDGWLSKADQGVNGYSFL